MDMEAGRSFGTGIAAPLSISSSPSRVVFILLATVAAALLVVILLPTGSFVAVVWVFMCLLFYCAVAFFYRNLFEQRMADEDNQILVHRRSLARPSRAAHFLVNHPEILNHVNLHVRLLQREEFDQSDYEVLLALDDTARPFAMTGANPGQISRLPTQTLDTESASKMAQKSCSICLESFESGAVVQTMPCLHRFHAHCLGTWLGINPTCPICKMSILGH
eukprot:TRINITY_DN9922_c0_g1_i1.p1 TRINITY_DN9922_c0_g1~~TRINITY_DN9922_c0_g1_i1.p1  ORF type:complete len:220 (+),score=26.91 TRINITY_DN9922_c0_g1_i1:184-843(+)